MKWYPLTTVCPQCKKTFNGFEVCFSADGELKFTAPCHECKVLVEYKAYSSTLAHDALIRDLMQTKQPKLIAQAEGGVPPPLLNEEDLKFLHELGSDDEEKP